MLYVDTADNNNLKIRNSSNNGFTTIGPVNTANLGLFPTSGGTLTGVLTLPNQSAGTPSINFGDSTTGFFRKASNQIGVATSGTEQLFLDQNGVTLNLQNEIRFGDANSSHYIGLKAAATISSNFTLSLPTSDGSNGDVLKTDGSGNLSFTTLSNAGTALTGNTLASNITASSLTSVGTLSSLTVSGSITGSIASSNISGALFTLGSTSVSRGNTITALAGMHQIAPSSNNSYSLGTSSLRWSNIFTNDLNLSNEGGSNDVDGTWGSYTIQEGKDSLFLLNKRNGKKYKFNLTEVT